VAGRRLCHPYFDASARSHGRDRISFRGISRAPEAGRYSAHMSIYRVHDTTGYDLGLLEHPAANLEPGDVVVVADGREAVVTARIEVEPGPGPLVALLEVALASSRLEAEEARP
jgi:hypothetical protein